MRLALNGATTMKAALTTDIRAAGAAGFELLEIWAAKLREYLRSHTAADLKDFFRSHRIAPYSINSIERITFRPPGEREALRSECEELCRIASEIACPYVVVVPGVMPKGASRRQVIDETVSVLGDLGGIAERHAVGLAFEFLGQPSCSVQTLDLADEIVRQVGRENVGLVIDTFHFYAGGSRADSLAALDPSRLYILHINDAEDRPRGELEDRHRLLPGHGILPLEEIFTQLRGAGYDGVASVEIFRPEYWERDPFELAREARAAAARVLGLES